MNRCPACQHIFRFEGIQTKGPNKSQVWRRWDACDTCRHWYVSDENGSPLFDTKEEPRKGVFVSW